MEPVVLVRYSSLGSKQFYSCLLFLILLIGAGCGAQYDQEIQKSLMKAYGHDFSAYQFRATPAGNFGVGTMYLKDLKDPQKNPESNWLVGHPDTMFVEALSTDDKQYLLKRIFVEGELGSAKFNREITSGLSLGAVIPTIQGLLNIGGDVDLTKGVTVTLSAKEAINRKMNWTEFTKAIKEGQIDSEIVKHLHRGDFVLGAADIVLAGYKVQVSVDQKANALLHAKLNEAVGKVLGKDASLKVTVSRTEKGTFAVESVNPVVAAVLYKEPPPARGSLLAEGVPSPDAWPAAHIESGRLQALENLLSQ
jgi:hypothetical protein